MPWIKVIPDEEAEGDVKEVYDYIRRQRGFDRVADLPPGLHSLNPQAMRHASDLAWQILNGDSRLTRQQREMIATVTSLVLDCEY